jgi:hypothetical protein
MKVKIENWLIVEKIIRSKESPVTINLKRTGRTNVTVNLVSKKLRTIVTNLKNRLRTALITVSDLLRFSVSSAQDWYFLVLGRYPILQVKTTGSGSS